MSGLPLLLALLIAITTITIASIVAVAWDTAPNVPRCQEDEIIYGTGDFNGEYWDGYECYPAGDI